MRVAEIYESRQGEGWLTGTQSVFMRASGCNLRCWFCDTPFTSWNPEGEELAVDEIMQRMVSFDCRHAVLTGGEPMIFSEMLPLCDRLAEHDFHITIETAGTLYLPLVCDLMSISPKLSNSTPQLASKQWRERHERSRIVPDVLNRLIADYAYQLKFVVDTAQDLDEIEDFLDRLQHVDDDRVWLMPQGTAIEELESIGLWLEPYCADRGYHFCPRKQIEWFGAVRGT